MASTISTEISAGQFPITNLKHRAYEINPNILAPASEVNIERGRDDDNSVTSTLMPGYSLKGFRTKNSRKVFGSIVQTKLADVALRTTTHAKHRYHGSHFSCWQSAYFVRCDEGSQQHDSRNDAILRDGKVNEWRIIIIHSDGVVEVEQS